MPLRGVANCDDDYGNTLLDSNLASQLLQQALPPLGSSNVLLDGERMQEQRSSPRIDNKTKFNSPNARIRLFCFYGVADASTSFRTWQSSPDWAEMRIVELPGHGYLADNGLPSCAFSFRNASHILTTDQLQAQRAEWVRSFADQMEPLVTSSENSASVPYALFGFSFGALLAYELYFELQSRGVAPPLALCACGRGAPHAVIHSMELQRDLQLWEDEQLLDFIEQKIGIPTHSIPVSRRSRMAKLFRCGMLFSGLYFGQCNGTEAQITESLWNMDSREKSAEEGIPHASNVSRVDCPVLSITGSMDTVWPPPLVERWSNCTVADHRHACFSGIAHGQLMNAPQTRTLVFQELARIALSSTSCNRQK